MSTEKWCLQKIGSEEQDDTAASCSSEPNVTDWLYDKTPLQALTKELVKHL